MKIIDKIKKILFEDEETELPVIDKETKDEEKLENIIDFKPIAEKDFVNELPKVKEDGSTKEIIVEERDVFHSENTFNFPFELDNQEFEQLPSRRNQNVLELEKENRRDLDRYSLNKPEPKNTEGEAKPFKASPIISPVYGVMDKNYKKEDIQEKPKVEISKSKQKSIDLEVVRKKAYGTLEDEIEITLDKPLKDFYKHVEEEEIKPAKTIDELLLDSMDEEEQEIKEEIIQKRTFEENSLNETFKLDEIIGEMKKSSNDLEKADDEDLFNLIDSMYSDKEDLDN